MLTLLWSSFCLFLVVFGQEEVVPNSRDVCRRDPPETLASRTPGDNGFRIKVIGKPPPERYIPGEVYTVTINGTYPNQKLLGFMLVATTQNSRDETTALGTFQNFNTGLTKFVDTCPHVVTHTYTHAKAGVEVLWTAPDAGAGCVEFRATVIQFNDIWYKDDGGLTFTFCEETGESPGGSEKLASPECCACGTGKYQMTFHGLWSRQTHPKDWPEHKGLLHWSNIVGASHGKNYHIWKYGGYATKGVKQVCEFGYSRQLEEEMRLHSGGIRTVVKTPGIWWSEPDGLRQTRWARFSVDRTNHFLSMLTMLGPSPDWCVGVSELDLCLPNCTWAGDMTINLYPWDGGTDDGITYMARNMKSDPQQKIQRLTHRWPNNPNSPFYGPKPMPPLAKLVIHRIHPKPGAIVECNENETEPEVADHEEPFAGADLAGLSEMERKKLMMMAVTDMEKKKLMEMNRDKCGTTEWSDWSFCSVTCGVGKRMRKRMFLNPMVDEDMCGISNIEAENCIGIENECERIGDECAVTAWSDWSPCSVTCEKGTRERRRYYLNKMDEKRCERNNRDVVACMAEIVDCNTALQMKNFTAICNLPKEIGPCRGRFIRFYYDVDMQKCLEFSYGGCRGNNNRFRSMDECVDMCVIGMSQQKKEEQMNKKVSSGSKKKGKGKKKKGNGSKGGNKKKDGPVNCLTTPWSEWSACSASCGQAIATRSRMVKREPENGGKKCPKRLEKKKRCKLPSCQSETPSDRPSRSRSHKNHRRKAVDCELGPWGPWSPCPKTCGRDSIQERSRQILHKPRRGGLPCEARLERRYCSLPVCPETPPKKKLTAEEKRERFAPEEIMEVDPPPV